MSNIIEITDSHDLECGNSLAYKIDNKYIIILGKNNGFSYYHKIKICSIINVITNDQDDICISNSNFDTITYAVPKNKIIFAINIIIATLLTYKNNKKIKKDFNTYDYINDYFNFSFNESKESFFSYIIIKSKLIIIKYYRKLSQYISIDLNKVQSISSKNFGEINIEYINDKKHTITILPQYTQKTLNSITNLLFLYNHNDNISKNIISI